MGNRSSLCGPGGETPPPGPFDVHPLSGGTWYFCHQHSLREDPQTMADFARIYGWQRVPCPHPHENTPAHPQNLGWIHEFLALYALYVLAVVVISSAMRKDTR